MTSVEASQVTRRVMVEARRLRLPVLPAVRFDPSRARRAVAQRRPGMWVLLLPGPSELTEDALVGDLLDGLAHLNPAADLSALRSRVAA